MSRAFFRRPEFRLHFGYPNITLTRGDVAEPLGAATLGQPSFPDDFRGLGDAVSRASGRLTVVLPEAEVWRGTLALAARAPFGRWRQARAAAATRLALPPAAIAVALGPPGAGGIPVAAVRRDTLDQTRSFLAAAGLRPAAFVGAGAFPGFDAAPRFGGWRLPLGLGLPRWPHAAATALAGAAAVTAMLGLAPPDPEPAPAAPVAAAPEVPAPIDLAAVAPRPRPAAHLAHAAAPAARRPATPWPVATVASRNLPLLGLERPEAVPDRLRLAELTTARARLTDALIATPLRRPAPAPAPAAAAPAEAPPPTAEAGPRPLHRPATAPAALAEPPGAAPAMVPAMVPGAAPATAPATTSAERPRPRPADAVAPALAAAITQAVEAAAAPVRVAAFAPDAAASARPPVHRPATRGTAAARPPAPAPQPAPQKLAARPPAPKVVAVQPARTPPPAAARPPQIARKPAPAPQRVVRQSPAPAVAAAPRQPTRAGRGNIALIGVFGASDNRHALVRLPTGDVRRVRPGDSVQGVQVAAVGSDSIRLRSGTRETVLSLPE